MPFHLKLNTGPMGNIVSRGPETLPARIRKVPVGRKDTKCHTVIALLNRECIAQASNYINDKNKFYKLLHGI